ncbi:uncharacterized protein ARB_00776 [Trichophyton benhamiae CBS 112371]|uniref:Uncharacterized protein n=1 Tax=Arthroderma benhamiae (strain ATCC MYA-4681 / CBS 112371) TaxID=663331 RepID=D4AX49_ARTBC|nr:uncharacterized protein ARB_00776 [Trichophyton benhamiae CBS 112371]EFE32254.1 hypothetical protein ARB_00776 [Trichophyton benhamiae CBS 112371]
MRSSDGVFDRLDRLYQSGITKLVYTLVGTDAALNLSSQIYDQKVGLDLADLLKEKGSFNYSLYRDLVRPVFQKAPEVDIWKAVFQLIKPLSQLTPPATVSPTSEGTSWRSTSSSQRGSEQIRRLVEERLFEEMRTCTHKDVEGFDAKYFRNTSWEERFINIYKK